jgi:hypothetical protein
LVKETLFKPPTLLARWSMTIYGREDMEPPHVTIKSPGGRDLFRWNLRTKRLMSKKPDPRLFPSEMEAILLERHAELCKRWDLMHPTNPVGGEDDDG